MSDDNQGPRVHPECPRCGDVKTESASRHHPCWRCIEAMGEGVRFRKGNAIGKSALARVGWGWPHADE